VGEAVVVARMAQMTFLPDCIWAAVVALEVELILTMVLVLVPMVAVVEMAVELFMFLQIRLT
jgi:hypothetical protein